MEPVSPTAAALLQLESARAPQHAGWLAHLDGSDGPLDVAALHEAIAARVGRAPRMRRVPVRAPDATGDLMWCEDPSFDVARHVVTLPGGTVGEDEVRRAVDQFLAEPLARELPLWSVLVVPATRGGGAVMVGKAHRALTDGQDAGLLRELVFDPPTAAPGAGAAAADALALDELRAVRRMATLGAGPARIGATLRRAALTRTAGPLMPAPPSFLGTASEGRTTLVTARVDLSRIARIADRTGATPHAVVLAIIAGTLRRLAIAGGDRVPGDVRALVPVTLGDGELLGDAPCTVLDLPVGEGRAASRLATVRHALDALLLPRDAGAKDTPTVIAGPPEELASRLILGARVCNVTIPSAEGPDGARRVGGLRVRALFPVAAVPEDHALALGTLTYDRHLHVSAVADTEAIAAIGRLPVMLVDAVEELGVSTGVRPAGLRPLESRPRAAGGARARRRPN